MKIEILKENKLKIMLEPDDLKEWGIDASNVLKNEPHSRDMFVEILKRAEKETGFCCVNSKLVVESAINSDKRQLTLYVTKVSSEKDRELFDKIYCENDVCVISGERVNLQEDSSVMARFKTLEDVVDVSKVFNHFCGYEMFSYNGGYYVTLPCRLENKISEFGEILNNCQRTIVEEHGNKIINKNAFFVIREAFG